MCGCACIDQHGEEQDGDDLGRSIYVGAGVAKRELSSKGVKGG